MTQLALLLALSLIGLVLSFAFGRLEVKRGAVSATVKRAEGALERASVAVLRLGAVRGLGLLVVPALGLSAFAVWGAPAGSVSGLGRAAFVVVALLAGGASALLQARLALGLGTRAASSAAGAIARGSSRAMRPLLRASLAVAIFGEGLGLLGVAAAFASLYAVRGGFAATGGDNASLAGEVVRLLPAFALGAAATGLALSREGSVAAAAARLGGGQAIEPEASRDGDARDPALLAELVGHLVGELLPRALISYVCGLCATVVAALLSVPGVGGAALSGAGTLSCLVLVLLVRAFGAVGAVCGVLAARATEDESSARALWRGQASAVVVALFGLGAALFWLERAHLAPLFVAGALGLVTMPLVAQLSWLPLRRNATSSRELQDTRSSGEAATIARGASSALASAWPALVTPPLGLIFIERVLSPHAPAGLLLLTFIAGVLSLTPFALALDGLRLLTTHSRGVATLARLELEPRRRGGKLDDGGALGGSSGATHISLGLALSLLLGLLALSGGGSVTTPSALGVGVLAASTGVTLLLVIGARATRSAVLGSRLVAAEVEAQLREFPRRHGIAIVPAEFTPSYKACIEATLSAARAASIVELGCLLAAPFALALLIHAAATPLVTAPLVGFGASVVFAGLVLALGGRATRAMLGELRQRLRGAESGSATSAAFGAESFGELVGVTAASSVEALALVLTLTVLCLAPLLR